MKDCVSSRCHSYSYHLLKAPLRCLSLGIFRPSISGSLEKAPCTDSVITEKVWKVALDTGANVLALNILEAEASSAIANSRRISLNDKIINHQQDR